MFLTQRCWSWQRWSVIPRTTGADDRDGMGVRFFSFPCHAFSCLSIDSADELFFNFSLERPASCAHSTCTTSIRWFWSSWSPWSVLYLRLANFAALSVAVGGPLGGCLAPPVSAVLLVFTCLLYVEQAFPNAWQFNLELCVLAAFPF